MEVRNATSASNTIIQNMCTTINSRVWGIDYITDQPSVQTFGKQIDIIKFICSLFSDLSTLQNLHAMEAENQCVFDSWNTQFNVMTSGIATHKACGKFYIDTLVRLSLISSL